MKRLVRGKTIGRCIEMSETVPALAPLSPRLRDCHLGSGEGARFVPRCHENSKVTTALVHRRLSHVVFDIAMLCRSSIRHEVPRGVKSCESDKAFERSRIVEEMEIAALVVHQGNTLQIVESYTILNRRHA